MPETIGCCLRQLQVQRLLWRTNPSESVVSRTPAWIQDPSFLLLRCSFLSSIYASPLGQHYQLCQSTPCVCWSHLLPSCQANNQLGGIQSDCTTNESSVGTFVTHITTHAFLNTTTPTFTWYKVKFSGCLWFHDCVVVLNPCCAALLYVSSQQQAWMYATSMAISQRYNSIVQTKSKSNKASGMILQGWILGGKVTILDID